MKKKLCLKRALAIGLTVSLTCAMAGCGAEETTKTDKTGQTWQDHQELLETMNRMTGAGDAEETDVDKEEMVYVLADSQGVPTDVIVSEWLKNTQGSETLQDVTSLTNVKNVKGDETYTDSEDGIIWKADGADIYYQGKGQGDLPVGVKVSYELDGETVTPEELLGKSGHVRIRYDYINNSSDTVVIDNKETDVYTPFVMATGILLPTDKFCNVVVSNGDVLSEGNNMIAFGIGMPGLSESLGLDDYPDLDLDVPDYFEISADVQDFSLGMALTFCSNTRMDLDSLNLDDSLDKLNDDMEQLTDGVQQLLDGSSQLYDGTTALKDGAQKLTTGVDRLYDGAQTYTEGVSSLYSGAAQLKDGGDSVDAGVQTVADKLALAKAGSTTLKAGLQKLNSKTPLLIDGIWNMRSGFAQVMAGYEGDENTVGAVAGAKAVAEGLSQLNQQVSALTLPDMSGQSAKLTEEQKSAVKQQIENFLTTDEQGKAAMKQATDSYIAGVEQLLVQNGVQLDAQTSAVLQAVMEGAFRQAFANIYITAYETGMEKGMEEVLTEVSTQLAAYAPAITQLKGAVDTLAEGSEAVSDGVEQLYEGTKKLSDGADEMYDSAKALPEGVSQLYDGSISLENGLGQLENGAITLKHGTSSLKGGIGRLYEGCATLHNSGSTLLTGMKQVQSGAQELTEGADKLQSGALELKDGIVRFNDEGISRLQSLVKEDLNHMADRVSAIADVNQSYSLYGGIAQGKKGSEKFVIKIEGIEE